VKQKEVSQRAQRQHSETQRKVDNSVNLSRVGGTGCDFSVNLCEMKRHTTCSNFYLSVLCAFSVFFAVKKITAESAKVFAEYRGEVFSKSFLRIFTVESIAQLRENALCEPL
jgi:hypothetical protein